MIGRIVHKFCPQAVQRLRLCTATSQNNILTKSLIMKFQDSIQPTSRGFHRSVPANIKVQGPAPDFKGLAVVDSDFKEIQLSDFKGKYLVVFFYPLDFTFVCPTEIIAFSDRINDFKALDTAVVGVSCDSHFSHLAWINTPRKSGGLGGLNYPLLSDFSKSIARDYNVLIESEGVPLRGLFIINPEGIVRQITVNDLPVGRSVDEILRLIKAFKFTDEHGEVCPANWNPESPTIKPTPNGSQEYFAKVN